MQLTTEERDELKRTLTEVVEEANLTLADLDDLEVNSMQFYELDGRVSELREFLEESGLADRAAGMSVEG